MTDLRPLQAVGHSEGERARPVDAAASCVAAGNSRAIAAYKLPLNTAFERARTTRYGEPVLDAIAGLGRRGDDEGRLVESTVVFVTVVSLFAFDSRSHGDRRLCVHDEPEGCERENAPSSAAKRSMCHCLLLRSSQVTGRTRPAV